MTEITVIGDRMLSAEHVRIAELIQEYDPDLSLAWVPPEERELNEAYPFAIIHSPPGVPPYIVKRLKENQVDHRVIMALFYADAANGNVLERITAENNAVQILKDRKQQEDREERNHLAAWLIRQDRSVTHNGVRYE